jgi:hypothetical protein
VPDAAEIIGTPAEGVARETTPSGLELYYQAAPKRLYRVNGVEVPSVTTVLDILHKPALTWWGMKVGVEGVSKLLEDAWIGPEATGTGWFLCDDHGGPADVDTITRLLTEAKLTVNHQRDKAADRGTRVHRQALERWAQTWELPDPFYFAEGERGYVEGLRKFLEAMPLLSPIHSELMVGSAEHGFAGRFDLYAQTPEIEIQTGPRTKRVIPNGAGIWDLKTSKGIYLSHEIQLAGYRLAMEESGYGRSDYEAVVVVRSDGTFDVKVSRAKPALFLAAKDLWDALQPFGGLR